MTEGEHRKEEGATRGDVLVDECTPVAGSPLKPDPRRAGRSINYISTPAIKQCYYQASARRPGKAGKSKCAVMLLPELCGTSLTQSGSSPPVCYTHAHTSHQTYRAHRVQGKQMLAIQQPKYNQQDAQKGKQKLINLWLITIWMVPTQVSLKKVTYIVSTIQLHSWPSEELMFFTMSRWTKKMSSKY